MKPWLLALMLGRRAQLVTQTFTANATVPIPPGVSRLESIIGKGAAGRPGSPGSQTYFYETTIVFDLRGGGQEATSSSGSGSGPIPGPGGCTYTNTPSSQVYVGYTTCTFYTDTSDSGSSPTTGASASGFGQTFVGGTGGAATPREVNNVPVTPGGSYNVIVPSGGSIVISYYL